MSKSKRKKKYNYVGAIIAFEAGLLDEAGVVELFQYLVDTGLAWQLQGFYGRTAAELIAGGHVVREGKFYARKSE